MGDMFLKLI